MRGAVEGIEGGANITVLEGPSLGVSPTSLRFEAFAGHQGVLNGMIQIQNLGNGTLSDLAVERVVFEPELSSAWLGWELEAASAPTRLHVTATPGSLSAGDHEAALEITSPQVANGPVRVLVHLTVVEPPPRLRLSPGSLSLTATAGSTEPASQDISVTNTGGGVLTGLELEIRYDPGAVEGWLEATLAGTTAPAGLRVSANPRRVAPGTYGATVLVSAPGAEPGQVALEVGFQVSGAAAAAEDEAP